MSDTDWICDKCNAYMNDQIGFSTLGGTWRCTECGALNSVSESDSFNFIEMLKNGIDEIIREPLEDPDDDDY